MRTLLRLPARHGVLLAAYAVLVFLGVRHHEPWFDEAQSWLLARDLGLSDLLFHQLRYEGTPGLWVMLLSIPTKAHLPYGSLGLIGGICAVAGMSVFLRYSPFPEPVKLLLPLSYFAAYQYAVVARSYALIPLFAFLAAYFYRQAKYETYQFAAALGLLANVSAHGTAIAVGFALAYAWEVLGVWSAFDADTRRRHVLAAAIFGLIIVAVVAMAWPPSDANFYAVYRQTTLALATDTTYTAIAGAFLGSRPISLAIFLLLAAWCSLRGRSAVFIVPVGLLLALYIRVWAQPWHLGILLFTAVSSLWVTWPTAEERRQFNKLSQTGYWIVTGVLAATFCFQFVWTAKTYAYDWSHAFSGSRDAAEYLKSVGADRSRLVAFGFSTTAVLPYFQSNIYTNEALLDRASFWHWSKANDATQNPQALLALVPDYAIIGWKTDQEEALYDQFLRKFGYTLVRESVGGMYFKYEVQQPDSYRIYKRNSMNIAPTFVEK